ncbi:MAG: hypothetical protein MJ252_03845 [archaeon]|nr:hypothetical protein [archaeon]
MNFTKLMPPHPKAAITSFVQTIPQSNIYMMAHPHHMEFTRANWGTFVQCTLIAIHVGIMLYYLNSIKDKKQRPTYVKRKEPETYWEIVKANSRVISLFLKTNTPLILKIDYLIHYASICFGVNAIFYKEPVINDLSDFICLNLTRSMTGLIICCTILAFTSAYLDCYEDEKKTQEDIFKSLQQFLYISLGFMVLSLYISSIFCYEFRNMQDNWFWGGLQGFCMTFSYRFFLPYGMHIASKIIFGNKPTSGTIEKTEIEADKKTN